MLFNFSQRKNGTQRAKETSRMFRLTAPFFVFIFFLSNSGKLQAQNYNPYTPEQAYWNAFNQQMTPVYNGARTIQRYSNGIIRYGGPLVRGGGTTVRTGYNQVQQYVERNVQLPGRYSYPVQPVHNRRRF